jgi:hypothetical protein
MKCMYYGSRPAAAATAAQNAGANLINQSETAAAAVEQPAPIAVGCWLPRLSRSPRLPPTIHRCCLPWLLCSCAVGWLGKLSLIICG